MPWRKWLSSASSMPCGVWVGVGWGSVKGGCGWGLIDGGGLGVSCAAAAACEMMRLHSYGETPRCRRSFIDPKLLNAKLQPTNHKQPSNQPMQPPSIQCAPRAWPSCRAVQAGGAPGGRPRGWPGGWWVEVDGIWGWWEGRGSGWAGVREKQVPGLRTTPAAPRPSKPRLVWCCDGNRGPQAAPYPNPVKLSHPQTTANHSIAQHGAANHRRTSSSADR